MKLPHMRMLMALGLSALFTGANPCQLPAAAAVAAATGTTAQEAPVPVATDLLPERSFREGWKSGEQEVFFRDSLYKRINGEAELYLPYGFESLVAANYTGPASKSLDVEIFRMGSPLDAFGIYSNYRDGAQERLALGFDGVISDSQVMFCQDRYFVRLSAPSSKQPARQTFIACAEAISGAISAKVPSPTPLPEPGLFDAPEIASRSVKFTATSLLGYAFFPKGLTAEAELDGKPLKFFAVLAGSEASAARALEQYVEYLRKEGGQPRLEQGDAAAGMTLLGRDPLYKGVVMRRVGSRLLGIAKFEDPAKGLPLINRWISGLKPEPTSIPDADPAPASEPASTAVPQPASGSSADTLGAVPGDVSMPRHIIRMIASVHCKRGPAACEQCRAVAGVKICLLDISPPNQGMVQRRVIELTIGGEKVWREFDVVRSFADEAEARAYAADNGITDLDFRNP